MCPHLHHSTSFFDHKLQSSKHTLRGATGVHVRVAIIRVIKRNDHGLMSGQLG